MSEKQPADLADLKKQVSARRLSSQIIARVSQKVERDISRNNLSLLWKEGPTSPLREMILEEARALVS
jgi:hypothetical protein